MTKDARGLSGERLNFIIAISAILISAASFYATYLQADAAEKQVRAMTLPLIQFEHGNYDTGADRAAINFNLKNAGVGPAIIRTVIFEYLGEKHKSLNQYLRACCNSVYRAYLEKSKNLPNASAADGAMINATLPNSILPGQSDVTFFKLFKSDLSGPLWESLNQTRWDLHLSVCFCSLLDDCYVSDKDNTIKEVRHCPLDTKPGKEAKS